MSRRVLVVEDDAQNSYLVRFILEKGGFEVSVAVDGQEAIDMVGEVRPDLILMDMLLPRVDGYEATRILKADPATASIPIVALTAYSMKGDRERILGAGCDGYIPKPLDPDTFVEQVTGFM
jgi:two-component system cell cycle response regulator DivK